MSDVTITTLDGETHLVQGAAGMSLMEAIRNSDVLSLLALCGGGCSCGTCHVYITSPHLDCLPPMQIDEEELLSSLSTRRDTSRLSCQLRFADMPEGLRLDLAPQP